MSSSKIEQRIYEATQLIRSARALIVSSGAGMGVDSGLSDFRGATGFWKAYPMYERLGIQFTEAANPIHFKRDPAFGWGFYGHRLDLYRHTQPHRGFELILKWVTQLGLDYFVLTSNVDGHFQRAGFSEDQILEVHGSIHHLQCLKSCRSRIWDNNEEVEVNESTMRAINLPVCPDCQGVARPNILMFGDFSWNSHRTDEQHDRFERFLSKQSGEGVVIIELGAGTGVPTIRMYDERICTSHGASLIRINPRDYGIPAGELALPLGALDALLRIDELL